MRGDFVRHTTAWSSRCSARRCARAALVRVIVASLLLTLSRRRYKEHESSRGCHCSKLTHSGRTPPFSILFFRIAEWRKQPYILSPFLSNGLYLPLHTAWGISSRPIVPTPHFLHAAA